MTINLENAKSPGKEIIQLFMAHGNKKANTILKEFEAEINELVSDGRRVNKKFITCSKTKEVVALHCNYFGRWMLIVGDNPVKFGRKGNAQSGYNYTSATGLALWTAQYAVYKVELIKLECKNLDDAAFKKAEAKLAATRDIVDRSSEPKCYGTREEAVEALAELGITGV